VNKSSIQRVGGALLLSSLAILTGCASKSLYQWAGYEDQLYASYKDPSKAEAMRNRLEAHIQQVRQSGTKVAPGLYAELGTLYLQAGQRRQAIGYYGLEKENWPESQQLMTALIQNLERLEQQAHGIKQ
jgi:hypothetical protein